jgi:hypothetical protein
VWAHFRGRRRVAAEKKAEKRLHLVNFIGNGSSIIGFFTSTTVLRLQFYMGMDEWEMLWARLDVSFDLAGLWNALRAPS